MVRAFLKISNNFLNVSLMLQHQSVVEPALLPDSGLIISLALGDE